jgi:hypothetical protein
VGIAPYLLEPGRLRDETEVEPVRYTANRKTIRSIIEVPAPRAKAAAGLLQAVRNLVARAGLLAGERHLILGAHRDAEAPAELESFGSRVRQSGMMIHGLPLSGEAPPALTTLCGHRRPSAEGREPGRCRQGIAAHIWGLQYQYEIRYRLGPEAASSTVAAAAATVRICSALECGEDSLVIE